MPHIETALPAVVGKATQSRSRLHQLCPVQDRQTVLHGLLQAATAAGGASCAAWPLQLVTAAGMPLAEAAAAIAEAIVRGVPGGPYPMQPNADAAQVLLSLSTDIFSRFASFVAPGVSSDP